MYGIAYYDLVDLFFRILKDWEILERANRKTYGKLPARYQITNKKTIISAQTMYMYKCRLAQHQALTPLEDPHASTAAAQPDVQKLGYEAVNLLLSTPRTQIVSRYIASRPRAEGSRGHRCFLLRICNTHLSSPGKRQLSVSTS